MKQTKSSIMEELTRRGDDGSDEGRLAIVLLRRLGQTAKQRAAELKDRHGRGLSIFGRSDEDPVYAVAALATGAAAYCATHETAVEARQDFLFYREVLSDLIARDAEAVEVAFPCDAATGAAAALRAVLDEPTDLLLDAYGDAKRTVATAAAQSRTAQQTAKDIKAARTAAEKARAAVEAQTPMIKQNNKGVKFLVKDRKKRISKNRKTGAKNRKSGLDWTGELEDANKQADAKTAAYERIKAAGNGYGDKKQAIAREAKKLGMKESTLRRAFYRWNAGTAGKKKAN